MLLDTDMPILRALCLLLAAVAMFCAFAVPLLAAATILTAAYDLLDRAPSAAASEDAATGGVPLLTPASSAAHPAP